MAKRSYKIELTEHQLMLMAQCVEDCHRFIAGQMKLDNSTSILKSFRELKDNLQGLQSLVTPLLEHGASYGWNGGGCTDDTQRRFIAETYYLYREIYHKITVERNKTDNLGFNVYLGETLRCKESGEPIKIEVVEHG